MRGVEERPSALVTEEPRIAFDGSAGRRLVAEWRAAREPAGGRPRTRASAMLAIALLSLAAATTPFTDFPVAPLHEPADRGFLPHAAPSSRAASTDPFGESAMRPSRSVALATPVLAAAAAFLTATSNANAEERRVPEDYPTIQAAIDAAVDGDVVSIAAGEYDVGLLVMPPKAIEVSGRDGVDPSTVRLRGEALRFNAASQSRTLRRLALVDFSGFGAIEIDRCSVVTEQVLIESGRANGVFLNTSARLDMQSCTIRGCSSGGYAYVSSTWNSADCLFESNGSSPYKTTAHTYGGGAAFHVGSGGEFVDCVFRKNDAQWGGAIGVTFSGNRVFRNCSFEGNTATDGAVYWSCQAGQAASFIDCTFCGSTTADFECSWIDGGGNRFEGAGCTPPCPADLVTDGSVNGADVAVLLNFWGTDGTGYPGVDLDGDGIVGGTDLATMLGAWGACPE